MNTILTILKTSKWWYWLPFGQYNMHCMEWIYKSTSNFEFYIKDIIITIYSILINIPTLLLIFYCIIKLTR